MMWTDALLDAKRHRGDPLADAVIAEVFAKGEREAVNTLMNSRGLTSAPPWSR